MLTTPVCLRCVVRKKNKSHVLVQCVSSCCDAVNFGFQGWVCVWVGEICFTGFVMHEHEEPGVYIDWLSLVYSTLALKLWEHFIQHVSSQLYTQTHSHIFIQAHFICLSAFNQTFTLQWMQLWVQCLPHATCSSQGSNLSNWTTVLPGTPGALVS